MQYLAPGVYVEETSYRAKSIAGVGTSVAGLVGPTRSGPLRGTPEVLTSFADFVRTYGDARPLQFGDHWVLNHTAIAAKAFFDGGGRQLFVSRVVSGVNGAGVEHSGSSADRASARDTAGTLTFQSRFPGLQGNYTLEVRWRDQENLLKMERLAEPAEGEVVFLEATGLASEVRATGISSRVPSGRFPLGFRGLVRREGTHFVIVDNLCELDAADGTAMTGTDLRPDGTSSGDEGILMVAGLVNDSETSVRYTRVRAKAPASGPLEEGTAASLTLTEEADLSGFTGETHWGELTTLRGSLNADGTEFTVDAGNNEGVAADITLNLTALAAMPSHIQSLNVQRNFDIDVLSGGPDGEVVYSYGNITTDPTGEQSLAAVLAELPARRSDALTSPVACMLGDSADNDTIVTALYELFDEDALSPPPTSVEGERYLIQLEGGSDGQAPAAVDYGGEADEVNGSTGFSAMEELEDIAIVMAPASAVEAANTHLAIVSEMQKHCRKMRYRVGIVDAREGMALSEVRALRNNFDDSRLALYYPWIVVADPTGEQETITVPPAGFIAGVYAHTDVQRGVHKTPANEPVIGALRFAQDINQFQQELLNPNGINCLRSFPGRGHRVWGGRTLSSDPEWQYLSVRRYFLYLGRSIEKSTQWIVFEPNGERLWGNVTTTVEDFLYNEWVSGRLLGPSPEVAFFVRCDRSTMTQNDLDNGRLVCEIGVAALKPAEFVIFRIGQKTADAV